MIDHRTARAVGKHTEAFGDDAHDVSVDPLNDDVGHVMPERVRVAQRARRLNDCVDSAQLVEGMRASGHRSVNEIGGPDELAADLAQIVKPGDFVVCLGAGDITKWAAGLATAIAGKRELAA